MSLSIFSSRKNPVRLIQLALAGFATYSAVLQLADPEVSAFQNQWVRNYSVAEKFIYADSLPRVVIVGSSMSARLVPERFGAGVYNLSFGGGSALTGLKIIRESQRIPELILIESNIAEKEPDEGMVDNLFIPFLWKIKGHIKSLQYTYQPINIFLSIVRSKYEKNNPAAAADRPEKKILESNLKLHIRNNSHIKGFSGREGLIELKKQIKYFKGRGAHVVFFEMPVHQALLMSPKYNELRSILSGLFPDTRFYWADRNSQERFLTSDGVHLLPRSAGEYTSLLNRYIENESGRAR